MSAKRKSIYIHSLVVFIFSLYLPIASADSAIWTNGTGNYSNPVNWNTNPIIPCNAETPPPEYDILIPADSGAVTVDISCAVNTLTLDSNNTFRINSSGVYTAVNTADIRGLVFLSGGSLNAPSMVFPGNTARFWVNGGSTISIDKTYYASSGSTGEATVNLRVDGSGSQISFPYLVEFDSGFDDGSPVATSHSIQSGNSGMIDFPSLQTIHSPQRAEDSLQITANYNGAINFDSVQSITGEGTTYIRALYGSDISLPNIQTAEHPVFNVQLGGKIHIDGSPLTYIASAASPALAIMYASGVDSLLDLRAINTIDARLSLHSATMQKISAEDSGAIDLSNLQDIINPQEPLDKIEIMAISGATINLDSLSSTAGTGFVHFIAANGSEIALPKLQTAENTVFEAWGGGEIHATGEPFTLVSKIAGIPREIISARGENSLLNLPSVETIDAGFDDNSADTRSNSVSAENGGVINLSGLHKIITPKRIEDRLILQAFGSIAPAELTVGTLENISGNGYVLLQLSYARAKITAPHGLLPNEKLRLNTGSQGGTIAIGGDFIFPHNSDSQFDLYPAKIHMNGMTSQRLEVPTKDDGNDADPAGLNLEIGQLYIGELGQATEIHLIDTKENDNGLDPCGTNGEVIYSLGFSTSPTEPDGLYIKGGSTLFLDTHNVYAMVDDTMMDLREALGDNEIMPFDDGFVAKGVPLAERDTDQDGVVDISDNCPLVANGPLKPDAGGSSQYDADDDGIGNICDPDFNNDLTINAADLAYLKLHFFTTDSDADLNGDGFVNASDLAILKKMYFGAPGPSCVIL